MDILFCVIGILLLLALIFQGESEFSIIIFVGLLIRFTILIIDLNHVFPILHSGADTEMFHRIAIVNQYNTIEVHRTNYTVFLTRVYSIFLNGNPRMVAQFINVMFGIGVILVVRRCLTILDISYKRKKQIILLMCLLPNFAIFSAILAREAWIEFFLALSVLFFIKWFLHSGVGVNNMILSILSVFAASYMHAGVIGLAVGYMIAFTMYNPSAKTVKISFMSIIAILFSIAVVSIFMSNLSAFGGKFANVEMSEEFIGEELTTASDQGGSNYMSWFNTSSPAVGLALLPLRMMLFLFSPLPIHWRGFSDVFAFACDGLIYLYLMWNILRVRINNRVVRKMRMFLLTSILITTAIFAFGTSNAGTAMRHRAKFLSVILITYGVSRDYAAKRKEITNSL